MDEKRLLELSMQSLSKDYASMDDGQGRSGGGGRGEDETAMRMEDLEDTQHDGMRADIQERILIELVIDGQVENVQAHLQVNPDTNVNAVDYQGRTALQMAVRNQNEEMIDYLISLTQLRMGDTLLYAVREGKPDIVEKLLQWQTRLEDAGILEGPFESAEFLPHMTPLMLACHENNYEIVQLLLHHGYTISVPAPDYYKDDPKASKIGETLELGVARVDSYMALASPIYMALTSADPILTAFVLSNESDRLQYTDPIYKQEYEEISERCREFAKDLLDECRSSEEVWILLTRNHDPQVLGVPTDNEYSRLSLALEFDQKSFVTHKNCQQVLQNLWTQHHPDVMWMSTLSMIWYFIPRLLLMPFVYLSMYLVPCSGLFHTWDAPMNKFLGDFVSFIVFIILVVSGVLAGADQTGSRVPGLNGGLDVIVWIYVMGYTWENIYILAEKGISAYHRDWWLIYRALMNLCFMAALISRLASYIMCKQHGPDYENEARIFWPWYDPILFSECFYAVGAILAIVRILYMFQVSQALGPLQLSLAPMFGDVFQMCVILAVIIFAFGTGFYRMYGYYTEMIRIDADEEKEQSEAFETWPGSLSSLFWIVFGFGDVADAEVIVSNTCSNSTSEVCYQANYHHLTQTVGSTLYATYHLIMATTLLNMLIAMMSNSLQTVQDNADQEWKFARSKVWMTYYERKRVLPIPMNILPSPWHFINVIRWIVSKCAGEKPDVSWSFERCCDVDEKKIDAERIAMWDQKYKNLIKRLIQRYLSQLVREGAKDEMVTPEHLEQVKIDIIKEMQRIQNPEKHEKKFMSLTSMAQKKRPSKRSGGGVGGGAGDDEVLGTLRGWNLYQQRLAREQAAGLTAASSTAPQHQPQPPTLAEQPEEEEQDEK